MGRCKIEIKNIDDPQKKMVTFCKRKNGIRSKSKELCKLFPEITLSVILFTPAAGRVQTFSNSPLGVCNEVERFLEEQTKGKKHDNWNVDHKGKNSMHYCGSMADVASGSGSRSDRCWWDDIDIDELNSVEKLKSTRDSLVNLKKNLIARQKQLTADSMSPLWSSSSTIDDRIVVVEDDVEDFNTEDTIEEDGVEDWIAEDRIVEYDAATTVTEAHDKAGKTCSEGHPNLDLNLHLWW